MRDGNDDDIRLAAIENMSSMVRKRDNVMTAEQYCEAMRKTNLGAARPHSGGDTQDAYRQYADSDLLYGSGGMWEDVHHDAVGGDFQSIRAEAQ